MPFPTTSILDSFGRADEGPPPSANWTDVSGTNGLKVISGTVGADGADGTSYWSASTFGPDCEVYVTLSTLPNDDSDAGVFLRSDGTLNEGYSIIVRRDDALGDTIKLICAPSTILDTYTITLQAGDSFGIRAHLAKIEVFYKATGATSYTSIITATDLTWSGAGYIGIGSLGDTNSRLDDFGGGAFVITYSTIVVTDSLGFTDDESYPLFPVDETLTLTDSITSVVGDTLGLDDSEIVITMPAPIIITDNLYLTDGEILDITGPDPTPPGDAGTGGVDTEQTTVLRLLYGNDKRNPVRTLDIAELLPDGNILLLSGGISPGSGELNELWSGDTIRTDGQQKLAESIKNSVLTIKYMLKTGGSQAALSYFQRKINLFFNDARLHNSTGKQSHKVWLEYRWTDGINNLPTPAVGQLAYYYEILSAKTPKWPQSLHGEGGFNLLEDGKIEGVEVELTCSPAPEGLRQQTFVAMGAVTQASKGVLIEYQSPMAGPASKFHLGAWAGGSATGFYNSGLTGNFAMTLWVTPSESWATGDHYLFDYYYNGSNRIIAMYSAGDWVITKILDGVIVGDTYTGAVTEDSNYHLVLSQDDTTLRLYINGVERCSVAATNAMYDGGTIALGCPATGTVNGANVTVDGFRILPYAAGESISSDEVSSLYDAEKPIKDDGGCVGLIPYWLTFTTGSACNNVMDSTRENYGVLAGISGDLPAKLELRTLATTATTDLWFGIKPVDDFDMTPDTYLVLESGSSGGSGLTTTYSNGNYDTITSSGSPPAWSKSASLSSLKPNIWSGRYRVLAHFEQSAVATTAKFSHTFEDNASADEVYTPGVTYTGTGTHDLVDLGDTFISCQDYDGNEYTSMYRFRLSGSASFTGKFDCVFLMPNGIKMSKSGAVCYRFVYDDGAGFEGGTVFNSVMSDRIAVTGRIRPEPGKYNYLFFMLDNFYAVTNSIAVTPFVTPRYVLPGGMVS